MPHISIIIPAYNAEKFIKKCLDSLLNQTKKEIEIIVINDGSTDRTEEIVKKYKDKRIRYFKNKNQGIGKSRNYGIEQAKGDYIMFIDSDDYLEKDACDLMYSKGKRDSLDIVVCDFYKEYDEGRIEEVRTPHFKNSSLKENPDIITEYLCPWAKLYRRSLLMDNNIRFVENLKYEDAPFVIEALDRAKSIGKVDSCLNYYLIHNNSETTVRDKRCFDIIKIIDIIRNYCRGKDYLKEKIDRLTVRIVTNYTIQQRVQEDKNVGFEFIDKAFDYLAQEVPDYKDNKYYENRGLARRTIEKSKLLTKTYCRLYRRK